MSAPRPCYEEPRVALYQADAVEVMRALPEASVDAVVTDPPYGLEFMGKEWDRLGDKSHGHASAERSGLGVPRGTYSVDKAFGGQLWCR